MHRIIIFCLLIPGLALSACSRAEQAAPDARTAKSTAAICEQDGGGISVPAGFCIQVFADDLGRVRHIAAAPDGRLFAILRSASEGHGLVALRDADGDGKAETIHRFGNLTGTGIRVHDGRLYASSDTAVYRWRLPDDGLEPTGEPELVVGGFPEQGQHAAKSLAIGDGKLYVNVGAPSNACMEQTRTKGSPGMDPCPLLEGHGGIWRFDANATGQSYSPARRFVTGIRNAVALAWNPTVGELYLVQHGRDQLHGLFPDLYSVEDSAELPAEEMFRVNEGDNFGWPYCYYDQRQGKKLLAPEFGGDGKSVGRCDKYERPIIAFPGHWAPNGLMFYTADAFPAHYRNGAFIAFHGSWNRAPEPQAGYKVVFVPFDGPLPAGGYETFASGFAGADSIASPSQAEYRPMGLVQGPDGALYVGDTEKGRIWKITYMR